MDYKKEKAVAGAFAFGMGSAAIWSLIGLVILVMWGCPKYTVYKSRLSGEAALSYSTAQRQVLVQQAQAEKDSAQLRADAIKIVGQAAKDFPEYRYQEFLGSFAEALKEGKINQIIYVPTEANVPLMEAGKR